MVALGTSLAASACAGSAIADEKAILTGRQASNLPHARYQPDWASLKRHACPKWFEDAKLGIFIHYGLYSVPAWAPTVKLTKRGEIDWRKFRPDLSDWFANDPYAEWYMNTMRIKDSPTWKHHIETYGKSFGYLDFIPMFNREVKKWDPDEWAELFRDIGARYVVPTTRHHDGFRLWPSKVRNPHRRPDQQGTQRDVIGELAAAVRKQGMHFGIYFSGGLDWSFTKTPILTIQGLNDHIPESEEYGRYVHALLEELIHRYEPDDIWNDIAYPKTGNVLGLLADYYNTVPGAAIDDRFKSAVERPDEHGGSASLGHADYTTPEGVWSKEIIHRKWESCHALGTSFGYNQNEGPEDMLAPGQLVEMFVDIVSKNGNLLLDIGPKSDGSISELQLSRVRELGKWLRTNGEAIYETRPWVRSEGRTRDGVPIRFTRKDGALYAILLARPKSREIVIESLRTSERTRVRMLGVDDDLACAAAGGDLRVSLPSAIPGNYAYVLKVSPRPS